MLCLLGLSFDLYLSQKRKQLILSSLTLEDTCPYLLSEWDMDLLKSLVKAQ
jgi:hypothetical protein